MSKELEALKGIKKAIAEHLHKQTGVSVEKHFEYLQNDTDISIIEQAINELKRLKKFKETFDNYELAKKQDFIVYENWIECEAELKKLPTAEEVCEALSEFMGREVSYTNKQFHYTIKNTQVLMFVTETYDNNTFSLGVYLPPHLITLIGRFYEGERK